VWPQKKILNALNRKRVLRFVREDLFEKSIPEITSAVLSGCHKSNYTLLVKTSSVNIENYIEEIKLIKHCIVFSVTDLLPDYKKKIKVIDKCVRSGLNITLSLSPIFEFNKRIKYILSRVNQNILGVFVGWLHGSASLLPPEILNRADYKYVRFERQYKVNHLVNTVSQIFNETSKRGIELRHYFGSNFYGEGACCFVDKI